MSTDIVSWNIQTATGVDGITSSERIAKDIRDFADADVICLQEVLRTGENDHVSDIASFFPQHEVYFGPAINRAHPSGRLEFGNMVLSVLQVINHKLHSINRDRATPGLGDVVEGNSPATFLFVLHQRNYDIEVR